MHAYHMPMVDQVIGRLLNINDMVLESGNYTHYNLALNISGQNYTI